MTFVNLYIVPQLTLYMDAYLIVEQDYQDGKEAEKVVQVSSSAGLAPRMIGISSSFSSFAVGCWAHVMAISVGWAACLELGKWKGRGLQLHVFDNNG